MRLLIATDHCFLRHTSGVYDTYCFDHAFFDDYRRVFDSLEVISRVQFTPTLVAGAFRSDGDGVRFVAVPSVRRAKWTLAAPYLSKPMLDNAVRKADAVVARVPSELGHLAARLACRLNKPYMVEVIGDPQLALTHSGRGLSYRLLGRVGAWRLRLLARNAEVASYVSSYLSRLYPPADAKPFDIISSIRMKSSDITSSRPFRSAGAIRIIQVGSLTPYKRGQDLIQACRLVRDQGIAIRLQFAGDGPERESLVGLRNSLGLEAAVSLQGHIADRQQLNGLLDTNDLFVLASATEGLPRALLEAMARGLPVIGSKIPGIEELVDQSELFPVGDVRALADLIVALARNPERMTALSDYSLSVAKRYTSDVLSPRRMHLYSILMQVAAGRRGTTGASQS